MENKEMKKTIPEEIGDDALDEVSGGLSTDSVSKNDTLGVPAIFNPSDEYMQNSH